MGSEDSIPNAVEGAIGDMNNESGMIRKYSLRAKSIQKRLEVEQRRSQPKQRKPRSRPPALSKYRRKSANARERFRMQEMNDAFETLRRAVPKSEFLYRTSSEKDTKIATLRLAMDYIQDLCRLLGEDTNQKDDVESSEYHRQMIQSCSNVSSYSIDFMFDSDSTFDEVLGPFSNIPSLPDAFDFFGLESDGDSLNFDSDLSDQAITL
ncbi:helix-loop-helix protein delilah-like [Artemia franciscana]|uniref:BHLH domain-containing protein n=1 Tax=Artemia franciscana TaxID=6661 RepID=A0AA88KZM3_ARTSF|nr:hypothetical protein QYM36_015673 [Artemia franciscana]